MASLNYFLGLFLVFLYSIDRFNTPSTNKLSTTLSKYYTGMAMYLVVYFFIYHALIAFGNLDLLVKNINPDIAKLPKEIISAMIVTVLLPVVPYIKEFDKLLKSKIYIMVNIPTEVSYLARQLKKYELFKSDEELSLAAKDLLVAEGFDQDKLAALINDKLIRSWNLATVLKDKIASCIDPAEYSTFMDAYAAKIDELDEKYKEILPYICSYVKGGAGSIAKQADVISSVEKSLSALLEEYYLLIAKAMLSKFNMPGKKAKLLTAMGFVDVKHDDVRMNWDIMSMIFISIVLIYFGKYALEGGGLSEHKFKVILIIAVGYCTAVFWAIYPKVYWPLAERQPGEPRRYTYYLVAMMLTAVMVLAFRFVVGAVGGRELDVILESLAKYSYWQIPSTVMVLQLAFFLDCRKTLVNRWVEGVIGGSVNCLSYFVATEQMGKVPGEIDFIPPFVIGMLVCSTVPHWYRRALANKTAAESESQPRQRELVMN